MSLWHGEKSNRVLIRSILLFVLQKLSHYELNDELIVQSGKFQQLDKMLPELKAQNHRVLIFSQFVLMLNIIEEYLNIKGYKFLRLDGSTQVIIR